MATTLSDFSGASTDFKTNYKNINLIENKATMNYCIRFKQYGWKKVKVSEKEINIKTIKGKKETLPIMHLEKHIAEF